MSIAAQNPHLALAAAAVALQHLPSTADSPSIAAASISAPTRSFNSLPKDESCPPHVTEAPYQAPRANVRQRPRWIVPEDPDERWVNGNARNTVI